MTNVTPFTRHLTRGDGAIIGYSITIKDKGYTMNVKYFLTAYHSKRDTSGNVYWALEMRDADTGATVCGTVSGGESNIRGMMHGFTTPDEWDRSILFYVEEMPIRKFNAMTKDWRYAGCTWDQLTAFVKSGLGVL